MKNISLPMAEKDICSLHAGETVLISGEMLTARDAAHKRLVEMLKNGKELPVSFSGATIYYTGPCPKKAGMACGSTGPTTSARMNAYAPELIKLGLKAIIGKGEMSAEVADALKENRAVYFAAIGGAGALYAKCVTSASVVAFADLKSEAIFRMTVKDFPAVVAMDAFGNSIYTR